MALRVVTEEPYNAEAELPALAAPLTPVAHFYVRNNFDVPQLDASHWRLRLRGRVRRTLELSLPELKQLRTITCRVTLECAGNGRALLEPAVPGTAWGLGAAGTAEFTGVPLREILTAAGLHDDAVECVFTGADSGVVAERGRIRFQRSLPIQVATREGPLLAWAMNDEPLTPAHGSPLRLVVPRWYAVASVKWLTDIDVVDTPFDGHFQQDRYVYRGDAFPERPVTVMRVRSLITSHGDGAVVAAGDVTIAGVAWSGAAPVECVTLDVSNGSETSSHAARLERSSAGVAAPWQCTVRLQPGAATVRARAIDTSGDAQPDEPPWNALGYGNNVVHAVSLQVTPPDIAPESV